MSDDDYTDGQADRRASIVAWLHRRRSRGDLHPAAAAALEMAADAIEAGDDTRPDPDPRLDQLVAWLDSPRPRHGDVVVADAAAADRLVEALVAEGARRRPEEGRVVKRGHRWLAVLIEGERAPEWLSRVAGSG